MSLFKVLIEGEIGGEVTTYYPNINSSVDSVSWDYFFKRLIREGVFEDWLENECGYFGVRAQYDNWEEYVDFSIHISNGHIFYDERFTRTYKSSDCIRK